MPLFLGAMPLFLGATPLFLGATPLFLGKLCSRRVHAAALLAPAQPGFLVALEHAVPPRQPQSKLGEPHRLAALIPTQLQAPRPRDAAAEQVVGIMNDVEGHTNAGI